MDQDDGDPAAPSEAQPDALPGSIPVTDCLFCSHHSKSLMKNLSHMTKVHSFFIPDVEFLVDLKGLIRYLGEPLLLLLPLPSLAPPPHPLSLPPRMGTESSLIFISC